tara:strand:+ start:501 stop:629 length:129 start_codon:yes stop_codon:yes gene_type:complete
MSAILKDTFPPIVEVAEFVMQQLLFIAFFSNLHIKANDLIKG